MEKYRSLLRSYTDVQEQPVNGEVDQWHNPSDGEAKQVVDGAEGC